MKMNSQLLTGAGLGLLGCAIAVAFASGLGWARSIPVRELSVTAERSSPPLVTADSAVAPLVVQAMPSSDADPFRPREAGRRSGFGVPEPPPPPLDLPEPPRTPFGAP
jgi:hypothetical protein